MNGRILLALLVIAALTVACSSPSDVPKAADSPTQDAAGEPSTQDVAQSPPAQEIAAPVAEETAPRTPPGQETTNVPAVQEIRIEAFKWGFEPSRITVPVETRVRLIATSREGEHGISIPEFDVTTGTFGPGETKTVEFIADKTGTFSFRCNVYCGEGHREMTGTIVVT